MREDDWLIGWGCAATMYPTQLGPATARVIVTPQGTERVQTAAHEIGTGAYTMIALTVGRPAWYRARQGAGRDR